MKIIEYKYVCRSTDPFLILYAMLDIYRRECANFDMIKEKHNDFINYTKIEILKTKK